MKKLLLSNFAIALVIFISLFSTKALCQTISTFATGLSSPYGIAFDAIGNLYVDDLGNNAICKVNPSGVVSTFVSSGINSPRGLVFDASGNLYVANEGDNTISKITPAGVISTFVSSGISGPRGLVFDARGNLYVANTRNNTISKVTPSGIVSTFVSSGISLPRGIVFDASGNLYVANAGNNTISKVTPSGILSTFVNSSSVINTPQGLAFDSNGNLYISNFYSNTISIITPDGVFVGSASSGGNSSGFIAFDKNGNLYVENRSDGTICKLTFTITSISPNTASKGKVVTISGTNFSSVKGVSFGGVPASSYSVINNNTIKAVVGNGASGYVNVNKSSGMDSLGGFVFTASISSFSPTTGSYSTPITIHGSGFNTLNNSWVNGKGDKYLNGIIYFGKHDAKYHEDSISIISDSVLIAWVGNGISGNIYLYDLSNNITDSLSGFTYLPQAPITNSGWEYVGKAGISNSKVHPSVNAVCGTDNIPYMVYLDAASYQIGVMKYVAGNWANVGISGTIGLCKSPNNNIDSIQYLQILLDNTNTPIVAYNDSINNGAFTLKKFQGGSWITFSTQTNFKLGSLAIDKNNILYNFDGSSVYQFNSSYWSQVGKLNFATTYWPIYGSSNISIDKTTNLPYVIFTIQDSTSGQNQTTVMKFDGTNWNTVGQDMIALSDANWGMYYTDIAIDTAGNPWVSAQTDNGFERASVYKFVNGVWNAVGFPHFSKSHVYNLSFALNKKNKPYLLYQDGTYNGQGTVMTYTDTGTWKPMGTRGFVPSTYFSRNSLVIDGNNTPLIAFSDNSQGGKVSMMKYFSDPLPISFLSINALKNERSVILIWKTENELNTTNFIIQHSSDGKSFSVINSIAAIGSGANNYEFFDNKPAVGMNYYRLQSVDKDGSSTYSKVVSINFADKESISIIPNPAKDFATIRFSKAQENSTLAVYDISGKPVIKEMLNGSLKSYQLNTQKLKNGVYVIKINSSTGSYNEKLLINK